MNNPNETYLGDSVYARWMGENAGVYIFLNNGMGEKNHIFMEPEVLDALQGFVRSMRPITAHGITPEPSDEA